MEGFILGPLPTGWECKIEPKMGRLYYINHTAKSTTWDDPRLVSIPAPPYHVAITQPTAYFEEAVGSRWSSPVPSVRHFSLNRRGSSPRLGGSPRIAPSPTPPPRNKRNEPVVQLVGSVELHQQRGGPAPSILHQLSHPAASHHNHHVHLVDVIPERPPSSFSSSSYSALPSTHLISCDPDTAYRTVCNLFPTAPETHIRHFFHKYHNRANLVVSALQVEKYPLASDINHLDISPKSHGGRDEDTDTILSLQDTKSIGISSPYKVNSSSYATSPARTGTPVSLLKFSNNQSSVGSLLTRSWGSPIPPKSPQMQLVKEASTTKAQKSPKMKLKYMKTIFPAADETILLDVLSSVENNVQKASEKLMRKGFSRTPPPKPARQKWLEVKSLIEKRQRALDQQRLVNFQHEIRGEPQESPFPTPIMKTARPHPTTQEKADARAYLVQNFPNLPDRFLSWALEVAHFQKDKAERLLREVGPQTPEEFKPFLAQPGAEGEAGSTADEPDRKYSLAEVVVSAALNNNLEISGIKSVSKIAQTPDDPDSGYFEIESKPIRKKGFLTTLLNLKSGKTDKSYIGASKKAKGPNSALAKGSNPGLIQTNYIQTRGPSTRVSGASRAQGPQGRAQGPNAAYHVGSMWASRTAARQQPVQVIVEGY